MLITKTNAKVLMENQYYFVLMEIIISFTNIINGKPTYFVLMEIIICFTNGKPIVICFNGNNYLFH